MKAYLAAFKSVNGLLTGIGLVVPGLSYFTSFPPPFLDESSLLTAALATATVIIAFYYKPNRRAKGSRLPPYVTLARNVLIAAIVILMVYIVLLRLCTVVHPSGQRRYQIGFGKAEWGLTREGQEWKAENPGQTVQDWMMSAAAFRPGGPELFWKSWTIYVSGLLMIFTFAAAFVLWTFGRALLAKQESIKKQLSVKRKRNQTAEKPVNTPN